MPTERWGKIRLGSRCPKGCRLGLLGAVMLALFLVPEWGLAQGGRGAGGPRGRGPRAGRMGPRMQGSGQHQHPPGFFRRLRDLPPQEQERVLANDARFQRLPPQRQEQIRENLRRWNALSSEQRERLRQRQEIFESLSPAQRQEARTIFPEWRSLPLDRQHAVMQTFRQLRDLPPQQRQQFLNSPDVQKLSPQERHILDGLHHLLPGARVDEFDESED